jgi:hypothetical protein
LGLEAMARTDLVQLSVDAIPSTRPAWSDVRLTATARAHRIIAHALEIAADEMEALSPAASAASRRYGSPASA